MKYLFNQSLINLMVWPTTPKEMKGEVEIKVNVHYSVDLEVNDKIITDNGEHYGIWSITEIHSKKESSIKNMMYLVCSAERTRIQRRELDSVKHLIVDDRRGNLIKINR